MQTSNIFRFQTNQTRSICMVLLA